MQHTERTTVAHHRSDFIYHTWGEWVELTDTKSEVRQTRRVRWDRQDEWGETDKTSEVRQTRRVRWDRQEEWGETDKKSEVRQTRRVRWDRQDDGRRVSKLNVKVPVLKIFWILKSLLTSAINLSQWFWTFFPPGRTMVQVHVSRAARMSFTYYVINTNQPDL